MTTSVTNLEPAQTALRLHFLGWQCRIRQHAMRHSEGRPSTGMRPSVRFTESTESLGEIITIMTKADPVDITAELQHMYRKTHDPASRRESASKYFSESYYQRAREFSDQLTALFGPDSELANRLLSGGECDLEFEQFSQRYRIPCRVRSLPESDPAYQATFWHNSLFNSSLPGGIYIIAFVPDWAHAQASPAVAGR